ncbi:cyclin-like protein [Pseudomassariella vexata]|uniref:RNA polymerase II holoenzyme cyclin-like subunit n=1 Tax=Pseudomassariella vexata TaxID=1141098 RepID=A0A1Y2DE33_9PEZI|nr:cyclin-like protein [Pseudomassariella vexata]ORY57528.1 cyclin-like protein [Pseudomassariella vexata]
MASIDRYRPPAREGYQPPIMASNATVASAARTSRSPSKRREIPPAVPTPPPPHLFRTSPPPRTRSRQQSQSPPPTPATMLNQWFFNQDEVLSSPSILDGLSPAEERLRRAKGVNFIYQAGILLDLPQITLYVAGVYFHRFYMRRSMVEEKGGVHHYNIAATALFLANKTEENCRKTKDIIIAVAKVAQKNAKLIIDEQSKEYWRWRDSILAYEEVMLENLTFDLMIDNPHSQLYKLLEQLGIIHNKHLRHAAWAYCNDSCLTPLPLLMDARDIAIASIFFSSTFTRQRIEDVNNEPWWKAVQGNEPLMSKAIDVLRDFYIENPLRKQENPYQGSPEFNLENTRKNGEGSSTNVTPHVDRDTLSPKDRVNGSDMTAGSKEPDAESKAAEEASRALGDSDAILKEAANDPTTHLSTNGNGAEGLSPGVKRSLGEVEPLAPEETREVKRPRTGSDDDEGEVHE